MAPPGSSPRGTLATGLPRLLGLGLAGAALAVLPAVRAAEPLQMASAGLRAGESAVPEALPQGGLGPVLRVLLLEAPAATIRPAAAAAAVRVRDGQGTLLISLSGAPALQIEPHGGGLQLRRAEDLSAPPLQAREFWIEAAASEEDGDPGLWLQQRRYRGRLQVRLQGSTLQVVNHVPLETYLASVVGSEMPASWPLDALQAQAVAARTYALKSRRAAEPFDLKATVASQVYRGVEAETPSTRAAVAGTRGLVLTYNDTLIDAVFHSSSGGSTESSGDLWPRQLPYLVSVPDFDDASPVREWRQPLDATLLRKAFPELGGALSIEVLSTTATGRVRQARVVGPGGQLLLNGAQLRSRLGLRSTWVRFEPLVATPIPPPLPALSLPDPLRIGPQPDSGPQAPTGAALSGVEDPLAQPLPPTVLLALGRGFGHGVGMSQWGALAMAQRGEPYGAILRHYYRGTRLRPYDDLAAWAEAGAGSSAAASAPLAVTR